MATHRPSESQRLRITKERWEVFNKKFRIEIRWDTSAAETSIKWHFCIKKGEVLSAAKFLMFFLLKSLRPMIPGFLLNVSMTSTFSAFGSGFWLSKPAGKSQLERSCLHLPRFFGEDWMADGKKFRKDVWWFTKLSTSESFHQTRELNCKRLEQTTLSFQSSAHHLHLYPPQISSVFLKQNHHPPRWNPRLSAIEVTRFHLWNNTGSLNDPITYDCKYQQKNLALRSLFVFRIPPKHQSFHGRCWLQWQQLGTEKTTNFAPQTSLQAKLTSSASHSKLSAGTLRSSDGLGNETWKKKVIPGDTPFKGSMAFLYLFML